MQESTQKPQNPDDMIFANGQAEAKEAEDLYRAAAEYRAQVEELKDLYQKNAALVEQLRDMNVATTQGIQTVLKAASDKMEAASDKVEENSRNLQHLDLTGVQQSVADTSAKTGEQILGSAKETQSRISDLIQQSDDFSHKENVRVYRNIQAATDQLLQKQTQELKDEIAPLKQEKKPKATGVQIATLLFVILLLLVEVCDSLGIISRFFGNLF